MTPPTYRARVARSGVQRFPGVDRTVFIPPQALRAPAAIETLRHAPVVLEHPEGSMVTPWRDRPRVRPVGFVRDEIGFVDGDELGLGWIEVGLEIADPEVIAQIDAGELTETSPAFGGVLAAHSGHWLGETFEAMFGDLHFDHVMLCPPGTAAGGPSLCIMKVG